MCPLLGVSAQGGSTVTGNHEFLPKAYPKQRKLLLVSHTGHLDVKYDCGRHHVMNERRPSERISYCKRRTRRACERGYPYARYGLDMAYPGGPSMRIVVDKIYVFWEIPTHSMTLIGTQSVLINIT